jgi:hypothetical protein
VTTDTELEKTAKAYQGVLYPTLARRYKEKWASIRRAAVFGRDLNQTLTECMLLVKPMTISHNCWKSKTQKGGLKRSFATSIRCTEIRTVEVVDV